MSRIFSFVVKGKFGKTSKESENVMKMIAGMPKVPKITSLQYLYSISKQVVRSEVNCLHAERHQSFLQVDLNTFGIKVSSNVILPLLMGMIKGFSKYSKSQVCIIFTLSQKKEKSRMEFIFSHADQIQVFESFFFAVMRA